MTGSGPELDKDYIMEVKTRKSTDCCEKWPELFIVALTINKQLGGLWDRLETYIPQVWFRPFLAEKKDEWSQ